ncbi:MAG: hypothetical protein MRY74_08665 [Neomegalonema sp.]|nr:hypothetical protein [Neomegalonema sp.]
MSWRTKLNSALIVATLLCAPMATAQTVPPIADPKLGPADRATPPTPEPRPRAEEPAPAPAPTPAPSTGAKPPAGARLIGLDEFRKLFIGKTVTFHLANGAPWGLEYYDPNGRRAIFRHLDGRCLDGHWEKRGDYYCFFYRDRPSCWLTYRIGDRIEVLAKDGERQKIVKIESNRPISCAPEAVSQLPRFSPPVKGRHHG